MEVDLRKIVGRYGFLFLVAGLIIFVDQWTKHLVRTRLDFGEVWAPWSNVLPFIKVVHWTNTGAAFGLFQNLGLFFTVLAFVVIVAILYYYPRIPDEEWPLRVALAMQLGGAGGNLVDRLTVEHVTDFIAVGNFPVFNVADSSISVGVALLLLGTWIMGRGKKHAQIPSDARISQSSESVGEGESL
ncbi:MAG: signal peptidase II [Chloroflexota bacterium]